MASIEETQLVPVNGKDGQTYGGRIFAADGAVIEMGDIHPDPARAQRFLERIRGEEAEETQLWYYLEDFLAEE